MLFASGVDIAIALLTLPRRYWPPLAVAKRWVPSFSCGKFSSLMVGRIIGQGLTPSEGGTPQTVRNLGRDKQRELL